MAIKYTLQGLLVYVTMAMYIAAFVSLLLKSKKLGNTLYSSAFILAISAFVYRWIHVNHVPLQNLFEVFLCLGMLAWPFTAFCRRYLGIGGETGDVLLACIALFPAGFVFNAEPQKLPPALQNWLFAPHVATYMVAYFLLTKASIQAAFQLSRRNDPREEGMVSYEQGTYRMILLGFPLLSLGLVLGAWWGKMAWGDYWNWDPKELWSLVTWLVYLGYFHFRYMFGTKYQKINSTLAISGAVVIVITLLWVNLSSVFSGMHSYAT